MDNKFDKPKVRYAVKYQDRNYEYVLHSAKGHFLRNLADVVNVLEYCVTVDLKKELYKPTEKLYNFNVVRLVNDKPDEKFNGEEFRETMLKVVQQIVLDNVQRNA
jgi:16S rRNA C1402 (ribose-2'-O) methylase RsmI